MLRLLRSPIAAFLLLASPGLSGVALDLAHPCPAKAVAVAAQGHHHGEQGGHSQQHDCKCIGKCHSSVPVRPVDSASLLVAALPAVPAVARPHHSAFIPIGRPADRLPPATAPPLV